MQVLVTGGAGFIGSHVVDALVGEGHHVRVLDVLSDAAHARRPTYLRDDVDYVEADLLTLADRPWLVADADAVAHLASRVGLGKDVLDAPDYVRDNDLGTAVLLRALAETDFAGRIALASSMVVYGEGRYRAPDGRVVRPGPRRPVDLAARRFEPRDPDSGHDLVPEAVGEGAPLDPRNTYAATKLHQEHLCRAFGTDGGVPVTMLRYHNVYGPRMPRDTPYAGVASIFRSAYEAGRPPQVFEDGEHSWAGLLGMATLPHARGRGAGRRVLAALAAWAGAHGADRLYLQVECDNRPALRLYESAGFGEVCRYHYRTAG